MMKDDGLLRSPALKAFADIANILTGNDKAIPNESHHLSPLSTGCAKRFAHVDSLCPNRELISR
jgi:hypothetical protein